MDGWLIDPGHEATGMERAGSDGKRCAEVARDLLARERYLSGAEIEFLERVAAGEDFETARMRSIAMNWGVVL